MSAITAHLDVPEPDGDEYIRQAAPLLAEDILRRLGTSGDATDPAIQLLAIEAAYVRLWNWRHEGGDQIPSDIPLQFVRWTSALEISVARVGAERIPGALALDILAHARRISSRYVDVMLPAGRA